jgi:hypothetical protein
MPEYKVRNASFGMVRTLHLTSSFFTDVTFIVVLYNQWFVMIHAFGWSECSRFRSFKGETATYNMSPNSATFLCQLVDVVAPS